MDASRLACAIAAALLSLCPVGLAQDSSQTPSTQTPSTSSSDDSSSSSSSSSDPGEYSSSKKTVHEKTGPDSSRTIRHTRVPEESEAPELMQAEEFIQKKDFAAAEPLLRKAVEREPANYEAWFDLGFVENDLGKLDDSIAAYRKSVAAKPDVFESNLNLGLQLAKTEQPDAVEFLRAATQLKPTSHVEEGQYRAWLSLGHVLEKANADEAIKAYGRAADLQPDQSEPHISAGRLFEMRGQYPKAAEEYKKALALDPASDALGGLVNVYMHQHNFAAAEPYLRQLAKAQPNDGAVHIQLGRVFAAEGKNDEAIAEMQEGLKITPNDLAAQRDLAETCAAAGKFDQAESIYKVMSASRPQDAELHRALGQTFMREKKFPEAQQEFITTLKLKPDFGEAYGDLAFAAGENKDYVLALKALDARAKLLPDIPITYFLRASALDHLKNYKVAAAQYRLFLQTAGGKYPDQEWQAKHRLVAIEPKK